ncbi:sensor histidine kinase [Butyrivibrio sp. WCD3002]|uniref:sensor histidine kinase n=1 Tax=Butyrivibrio sp. WCD3002 TaxID=1280676 RepID=UPI0003F56727|nr:histidine kinase [Butyrivibrio sp. WCD3002]
MILQKIQKKKDSFIFVVASFSVGYMILMVIILSAVWFNTSATLENGAASILTQSVAMSGYELDEIMRSNEQALYTILQSNDNIDVFEHGTETERAVAAQNMLQVLKKATQAGTGAQNLFFYDLIGGSYISSVSAMLSYNDTQAIEERIKNIKDENPGNMPSVWFNEQIDGKNYLFRMYKNKKRMLGAFIEVDTLFKDLLNEKVTLSLVDVDGNLIESFGDDDIAVNNEENNIVFDDSYIGAAKWTPDRKIYLMGTTTERWGFNLFAGITRAEVYGGFQTLQITLILLVAFAIVTLYAVMRYARRVVYKPLMEILDAMKQIEGGDSGKRLPREAETVEFRRINNSFNQMLDTIVNLKLKSYEERIQFDEATLKYVQLQIKPHFFLNALTTIHSMSYQNRNEDIRDYIEKLSENVRYLFKSGMHTVPLSEEIAHARNYIAMQDMLYPGCVFEFIDIEEDLSDYPIPQLIVHTILENIYKHAVSVDKLTSILISAKTEDRGDEPMCHITIEDDGDGYPEAFLKQVESGEVRVQENGHGVGLWNLKKTLELMYRRDDLIEFSNKEPQGSRTSIWIPRRVKRQSSVWKE